MGHMPSLETREFIAFITDNEPAGVHRRGYNGVAALVPRRTGNNLFVPYYAGLNYETIWLAGLPFYNEEHDSPFEPRAEPMHVEEADEERVVLVQPETSHAHVSARITFRAEEPCYLHQRIELTLHRRFCPEDRPNTFDSLWASYMHVPPDRHIYSKASPDGGELDGWYGLTKESHGAPEYQVKPLPADRELEAAEHLDAMDGQEPVANDASPLDPDAPLGFYYGICHEPQLVLMMFREPERFRLAYSPNGGGREPVWSPAWDYVLHLDDAEVGRAYAWDLCLCAKPYAGRRDVLDEVRRYSEA